MSNDTKITTREDVSRATDRPAKPKRWIDNWLLSIALATIGIILVFFAAVAIGRKVASDDRKAASVISTPLEKAKAFLDEITPRPSPAIVREAPPPDYRIEKQPISLFPEDAFRVVARLDKAGTIRVILRSGNREWEFVCENRGDMKRE